jgi:transcriptional regulator with XRE-family HTH domain
VGLTLSTVAKKTKLSLGYISQLELGMSSPSLDTLSRLCAVLELTFVQLFHLADIQDKFEDLERGALTKIPEIPS